ncbi:acyltransferase [Pseudoalteromonas sp. G4]|uniref:acyltransferase n=1 Tax=Pseudoalteromonas sp. G4 TaxID=2992761 RepID=UPI00237D42D3|nr:acyltransferase [Pseudoalteromonas sp. G4]MDE3270514.1 acyltransferase [Pseudoalteromonas sp. G4]
MARKLSLRQYVKRRNGVPLGASSSLTNMLKNALGAKNFSQFWLYWNPIWGYYLATKIQKPLTHFLPHTLALILTFSISGLLHDLAVSLIKKDTFFVCTPWFFVMSLAVIVSSKLKVDVSKYPFFIRAIIHTSTVIICYWVSYFALRLM